MNSYPSFRIRRIALTLLLLLVATRFLIAQTGGIQLKDNTDSRVDFRSPQEGEEDEAILVRTIELTTNYLDQNGNPITIMMQKGGNSELLDKLTVKYGVNTQSPFKTGIKWTPDLQTSTFKVILSANKADLPSRNGDFYILAAATTTTTPFDTIPLRLIFTEELTGAPEFVIWKNDQRSSPILQENLTLRKGEKRALNIQVKNVGTVAGRLAPVLEGEEAMKGTITISPSYVDSPLDANATRSIPLSIQANEEPGTQPSYQMKLILGKNTLANPLEVSLAIGIDIEGERPYPLWASILLGVAGIAGLFGGFYWWHKKRIASDTIVSAQTPTSFGGANPFDEFHGTEYLPIYQSIDDFYFEKVKKENAKTGAIKNASRALNNFLATATEPGKGKPILKTDAQTQLFSALQQFGKEKLNTMTQLAQEKLSVWEGNEQVFKGLGEALRDPDFGYTQLHSLLGGDLIGISGARQSIYDQLIARNLIEPTFQYLEFFWKPNEQESLTKPAGANAPLADEEEKSESIPHPPVSQASQPLMEDGLEEKILSLLREHQEHIENISILPTKLKSILSKNDGLQKEIATKEIDIQALQQKANEDSLTISSLRLQLEKEKADNQLFRNSPAYALYEQQLQTQHKAIPSEVATYAQGVLGLLNSLTDSTENMKDLMGKFPGQKTALKGRFSQLEEKVSPYLSTRKSFVSQIAGGTLSQDPNMNRAVERAQQEGQAALTHYLEEYLYEDILNPHFIFLEEAAHLDMFGQPSGEEDQEFIQAVRSQAEQRLSQLKETLKELSGYEVRADHLKDLIDQEKEWGCMIQTRDALSPLYANNPPEGERLIWEIKKLGFTRPDGTVEKSIIIKT